MALYAISIRQARDLPPPFFRFCLTADTLGLSYILPAAGRIRDFHPLERALTGRTRKNGRRKASRSHCASVSKGQNGHAQLRDPYIPASGHSKAKRPLRRFVLSAQRSAGNMAHLLNSTSDAAPQRSSKFDSIIIENSGNYKGNLIRMPAPPAACAAAEQASGAAAERVRPQNAARPGRGRTAASSRSCRTAAQTA